MVYAGARRGGERRVPKRQSILIADDCADIRRLLQYHLKELRVDLHEAG